jgi:HSP20 family protein
MRLVHYTSPAIRAFAPSFNGFRRSPWSGFEAEIDRLFDSALSDFSVLSGSQFPVDLYEDADNVYIRAELPGVVREDIEVEMADGELTLAAGRKVPAVDGKPEETLSFRRAVTVVADVDADKVTAGYENGVLTVTLPKREAARPRKINVEVK